MIVLHGFGVHLWWACAFSKWSFYGKRPSSSILGLVSNKSIDDFSPINFVTTLKESLRIGDLGGVFECISEATTWAIPCKMNCSAVFFASSPNCPVKLPDAI